MENKNKNKKQQQQQQNYCESGHKWEWVSWIGFDSHPWKFSELGWT